MEKIRIITDSASDLDGTASSLVTVLPMIVHIGTTDYLDGVTLTHKRFYELLVESDELPTTSLVSPGTFHDAFEECVKQGEKVIVIPVSSGLSGTFQSACLAAQDFPESVTVIDSQNGSVGEQALILYALQRIKDGLSYTELIRSVLTARDKIHILGLLDTLEYVKKGGRISPSAAFVGTVLHIKPVLTLKNGVIEILGTARGSKKGNNYLINEIQKTKGIDFSKPVCLGYTGLTDSMLQKYIADSEPLWRGHQSSLKVSTVGAAIGTHLGPGAVLVAFFEQDSDAQL